MADTDWGLMDNSLALGAVLHGQDTGITPPSGGGSAVYGFNSIDGEIIGAVGRHTVIANNSPTASGARIQGAIKRLSSAQTTGFSPLFFVSATGTDVNDNGYLLGLEDAAPYRIVLRKGTIIGGIPQATDDEYLRRSSQQYQISDDLWHHIALAATVQPNGEVYLNVYENDLTTNDVTSPVWTAIDGMTQFVDNVTGINSGSAPFTGGGYVGFAFSVQEAIGSRAAFDHIQIRRQT